MQFFINQTCIWFTYKHFIGYHVKWFIYRSSSHRRFLWIISKIGNLSQQTLKYSINPYFPTCRSHRSQHTRITCRLILAKLLSSIFVRNVWRINQSLGLLLRLFLLSLLHSELNDSRTNLSELQVFAGLWWQTEVLLCLQHSVSFYNRCLNTLKNIFRNWVSD